MLIYGTNPIKEALSSKRKIFELFHVEHTHKELVHLARQQNIKVSLLSKADMNKKFGPNHQSIAANVADYTMVDLADALHKPGKKLFVMLDGVEDPQNLGAVLRNVEAFGASGVIIPKHRSAQINATVAKVSVGALEYVDVIQVTNLNQAIKTLKEHNIWVVGTSLEATETLEDIYVDLDLCLVFGSEGKGLSQLVQKHCDYLVKIPMEGQLNSLNISVSTGVALYDISKRRRG